RPSKLRFEVDAHLPPGGIISSFIPRQALHPAFRHSNPASLKISSSPSSSACILTRADPGTTIPLTESFIFFPFTIADALRKSRNRELVQEPMKTWSI